MKPPPPDNPTVRSVRHTLVAFEMLHPGDAVLVGVSGGADSMALVHILAALAPGFHVRVAVAHLNHGLRRVDGRGDAHFVRDAARRLGLPYFYEEADVRGSAARRRLSLEAAGRLERYAFFDRVCDRNNFQRIAVGHHADDNAEQVLMFLLRGSGLTGLAGIPPVRSGRIIRPLSGLTHAEILDFVSAMDIPYVTDRSNMDIRHLRNRIRHRLIPELKAAYNPNVVEALNRFSAIVRDEDHWADSVVATVFEDCVAARSRHGLALSVPVLAEQHTAVRRRVVRMAIARVKGDLRHMTFAHVDAVVGLAISPAGGRPRELHLPGRVRAARLGDRLTIDRPPVPLRTLSPWGALSPTPPFALCIARPGRYFIPEISGAVTLTELSVEAVPADLGSDPLTAYFDADRARFPLILRSPRTGDRFHPLGMSGSRSLKKFLVDSKVPRDRRASVPLLLSQGRILWIAGCRTAHTARITEGTAAVLKVELLLA